MTPGELLTNLTARGVVLIRDGDRLGVKSPPGVLTDELRADLARYKLALMALLDPSMRVNLSPTFDEICAGYFDQHGFEVLRERSDPDLNGYPWQPKLYVRPIA